MKNIILILILFFSLFCSAQKQRFESWKNMADNDISLQPEYGAVKKSEEQIKADNEFKNEVLKKFNSPEEASKKMVETGFGYIYEKGDFMTAMKRFNQAFLFNKNNADIYYGYGTIYFNLGAYEEAREQFNKGLKINPDHSEMLTDYGTTYLGDFYESADKTNASENEKLWTAAENYFNRSLKINNKNSNTIYKLSIVSMYLKKCEQAQKYFKMAQEMGNPNITERFENELKKTCETKK
ncbi:tetratricopeptide repeat protein [Chryseobacterium herbae]|uniref:Tetratricopeptide repeat protein n=1 Tax=Chryseobacterium herbae TaxID=2976476 RepID=A0ABT2IQH5_9FLAO|nr:tetratricopeptide repeat protein [Chryseobacterium sp. pc1-10]MCT2561067.1 tetratricopeptide repeat protein [Chryseobacterium sp. pc1-10]